MLTLLQIINRMLHLEYSEKQIRAYLDAYAEGKITADQLFITIDLEMPHKSKLARFNNVLHNRESAIKTSIMMRGQ